MEFVWVKQAVKEGWVRMKMGGVVDLSYPSSKERRGRVQGGGMICPTVTCAGGLLSRVEKVGNEVKTAVLPVSKDGNLDIEGVAVMQYRIRKLTERECLRLMDVAEEDIDKMAEVNSVTQMYKQAGNSIVVNVMCAMFSQLNITGVKPWNECH